MEFYILFLPQYWIILFKLQKFLSINILSDALNIFVWNLSKSTGFISKQILIDLFTELRSILSYSCHNAGTKFDAMKESKRPDHV